MWYDCSECVFASNSPKLANDHTAHSGHTVNEEKE